MSLLRKRLAPNDSVRWISASNAGGSGWFAQHGERLFFRFIAVLVVALLIVTIILWDEGLTLGLISIIAVGLCLAAMFATYDLTDTEVALLADHVIWNDRWLLKKDLPRVRLDAIDLIDVEEAGNTVTLHCGDESHRLEEVAGGQVEEFARATGRRIRIWRRCNSPAANAARRWRSKARNWAWLSIGIGLIILMLSMREEMEATFNVMPKWMIVIGAPFVALIVGGLASAVGDALPHLFAGRSLTGPQRQDFVCAIADPRWDGVKPDHPRPPPQAGPLQRWAMRLAYGEVPEYDAWEPEIINPSTLTPR